MSDKGLLNFVWFLFNHVDEYYGNAGEPIEEWTVAEIYAIPYFKKHFDELAAEHKEWFIITEAEFVICDSQLRFTDTWDQAMSLMETLAQKFAREG